MTGDVCVWMERRECIAAGITCRDTERAYRWLIQRRADVGRSVHDFLVRLCLFVCSCVCLRVLRRRSRTYWLRGHDIVVTPSGRLIRGLIVLRHVTSYGVHVYFQVEATFPRTEARHIMLVSLSCRSSSFGARRRRAVLRPRRRRRTSISRRRRGGSASAWRMARRCCSVPA